MVAGVIVTRDLIECFLINYSIFQGKSNSSKISGERKKTVSGHNFLTIVAVVDQKRPIFKFSYIKHVN
jgi:hypothetical protein